MFNKISNNKVIKFIYNTLKIILFTALIFYVIFIVFQKISNNSSLLGYRVFTISTASMEPVYKTNDVIVVKETKINNLKTGEDIAYLGKQASFKDKIVVHRIIEIENKKQEKVFHTQGLANNIEDPIVTKDQIYGKVVGRLIIIGFINKVLKNTYGFILLVVIPLFLIIILEVADAIIELKLAKETEKSNKEKSNEDEVI